MLFKNFNHELGIIVLNFWVLKKIFKLSIKHVEHSGFLINHRVICLLRLGKQYYSPYN